MPRTAAQKAARKRRKAGKKMAPKAAAKVAHKAAVAIAGHGDYRPTRFARVKGKGDYATSLGNIGSAVGRGVGSVADIASSIYHAISGSGDYRGRASAAHAVYSGHKGPRGDAAMTALTGITNPGSMSMGAMSVAFNGGPPRVRHREFIGPIFGTTGFTTAVYRIQPGLLGSSTLFPWGASVAGCFQQYKLNGMLLEFVSTSSDYTSTTGLGSVMMSTLYDANATPLANQSAVDNNEFTTSAKPTESFIHPIECASEASPTIVRYVRNSNAVESSTTDDRLDDVGLFQISTIGNPNPGAELGELWATYDIEFLKPALPDIHEGTSYVASMDGTFANTATPTPFTIAPGSSLPVLLDDGTYGVAPNLGAVRIVMPEGYNGSYLCLVNTFLQGGSTPSGSTTILGYGTDITQLKLLNNGANASGTSVSTDGVINGANGLFVFCFSTIAESGAPLSAGQNYISLNTYYAAGYHNSTTVMILPIDDDVSLALSRIEKAIPTRVEAAISEQGSEINQLRDELRKLRSLFETGSTCPTPVLLSSSASSSSSAVPANEEPPSPDGDLGADLSQSVHIPRSMAARLSRALGGK
jgi:hypothetical protein